MSDAKIGFPAPIASRTALESPSEEDEFMTTSTVAYAERIEP
jgi:hypothetical protein